MNGLTSNPVAHVTSPAPRPVWQAIHRADPDALVTQSPAWVDCICALGGWEDASRLYEMHDGRQIMLPLVRRKGLPARVAVEASYDLAWGMGGLLAPGGVRADDVAAVLGDLASRPMLRISLRPNPLHADLWAAARRPGVLVVPRLAHVLDLEGGFDKVWTMRFRREARYAVRKAEQAGLHVECDTSGRLVPVFLELYERSVMRWAGQQHEPLALARWRAQRRDPRRKIERIAQLPDGASHLWAAWMGDQPVAAILVLQGANAHCTRGAMDRDLADSTHANFMLHRLAIEDACRAGCRVYHMGESGESQGLAQFKTRFGAQPHRYAEYRIERLPITRVDEGLRAFVKRIIGFRDV